MTDLDALKEDLHVLRERGDLAAALTATTAELHRLIKEIERLRVVAYLRACVPPARPSDYGHEAWAETVRAAVGVERAAVVAYLGFVAEEIVRDCCSGRVSDAADAIERGEHRKEEK